MQPRLRKAPRWAWVLQDEEHLPVMSLSLISIRPRRQIPASAEPAPMTGCPPALQLGEKRLETCLQPSCPLPTQAGHPAVLTEAGGLGGPVAIGLAGTGWVSQEQEPRSAAVPHHGADPPVIAVHHRVEIRFGPPAVHWGQGGCRGQCRASTLCRPRACTRIKLWVMCRICRCPRTAGETPHVRGTKTALPKLAVPSSAAIPKAPRCPCSGCTSAEGLVSQPAAAAIPTLAPLQFLVLSLAASQTDGCCARPVSVQVSWCHREPGRAGLKPGTTLSASSPVLRDLQGGGASPAKAHLSSHPAVVRTASSSSTQLLCKPAPTSPALTTGA